MTMEIIETMAGDAAVRFPGNDQEWFVMGRNGNVHRSPVEYGHGLMRISDHEVEMSMLEQDLAFDADQEFGMGHTCGYEEGYAEGLEAGREKDENVA